MSSDVYRILYCSRNVISGAAADRDVEISHILETARFNNSQHHVTGALLYSSGYFAQVLEGPQTAIDTTFERIQRDLRHGDITVLNNGRVGGRDFPEWSMAYVQPTMGRQADEVFHVLHQAIDHPNASSKEVLELLRTLVIQED